MKRVLCISPHFPPVNAADMQRIRQALPFLTEFGWDPSVITVRPELCEGVQDALLLKTVPDTVEVVQSNALPAQLTRKFGLGNLGIRSWPYLRRAVNRYLASHDVDLIFFSTTVFTSIAHGSAWKRKYGVPFVVDLQDPWRNDYYLNLSKKVRPPKFAFDHWQKSILERNTMPESAGIVAVSGNYIETMHKRYPALQEKPSLVLPFGVLPNDLEIARLLPTQCVRNSDELVIRYVGRGGPDMERAAKILFAAFRKGLSEQPNLFARFKFEFIGTSYASTGLGQQTIRPIATIEGVADYVTEDPDRLPYFEALKSLLEADGVIVFGSDDPSYTASKLYPYILADRPLLAIFHEASPAATMLREIGAGQLVEFGSAGDDIAVSKTQKALIEIGNHRLASQTDWTKFEQYSARSMARKLAEFFDIVCNRESKR